MKVNLSATSKRIQNILKTPLFKNINLETEFGLTLDGSDKILTVFHNGKSDELELVLNDVLAIFAKNRSLPDLWKINFREIESFLRDENHIPAFGAMAKEAEEVLNLQKITLIAEVINTAAIKDMRTLAGGLYHWEKLSLAAKNEWANGFLKIIGSELVFCDSQTLTLTKVQPEVTNRDLEILSQKIFDRFNIILPMKVVAV